MIHLSKEELTETLFVIASIVGRCENAQTKFREGTSIIGGSHISCTV